MTARSHSRNRNRQKRRERLRELQRERWFAARGLRPRRGRHRGMFGPKLRDRDEPTAP